MPEFPQGKYFFVTSSVRPSYGGLTRSIFNRSTLFHDVAGIETSVLTFDAFPYYDDVRNVWVAEGVITAGVQLLNIHEHYRLKTDWSVIDNTLELPTALVVSESCTFQVEMTPGGRPWRSRGLHAETGVAVLTDYLRDDGSTYMRMIPSPAGNDWAGGDRTLALFDMEGHVAAVYSGHREWFAAWITELAQDERTFIVADVQDPALHLLAKGDNFFNFGFAHGPHTNYPRQWNSTLTNLWSGVEARLSEFDGVISLTQWQDLDLKTRWGDRTNFFVVPHAIAKSEKPESGKVRAPQTAVIVARLSRQKRIDDAIRAFALVSAVLPDARLEIYGEGPDRAALEDLISELNVQASVFLMGHSETAKNAALDASVFLMSSRFEGQPMALLEAQARGCPVIAYDVKYGPRDCIEDTETGYLVEEGNIGEFATKIIELFRNPSDVARLSRNSISRSDQYGQREFIEKWQQVLDNSISNRSNRIRLENGLFEIHSFSVNLRPKADISREVSDRILVSAKASLVVQGSYLSSSPFGLKAVVRLFDGDSGTYLHKPLDNLVFLNQQQEFEFTLTAGDLNIFANMDADVIDIEVLVAGVNAGVTVKSSMSLVGFSSLIANIGTNRRFGFRSF